jgi:hypothetical protein
MDKLFAEKFLIGDTDSQDAAGYDGSGINPSGSINVKDVIATDPDQSDIKTDSPIKSDPNWKPTEDGDGDGEDGGTTDAASYIPFLALGLVAAFLFIKFGKK